MKHLANHECSPVQVPTRIRPALIMLLEAIRYAEQTNSDRWEFAVEMDLLAAHGLLTNDFRWLVRMGMVEHQREVTLDGDDGRVFRTSGDLTFSPPTCFILANPGISIAQELLKSESPVASPPSTSPGQADENGFLALNSKFYHREKNPGDKPNLPTWDLVRRELNVNGTLVKRFKWTAINQEAILAAFEEEGWPYRIDDPLPPKPDQDSKRRLSDTIKCLNRKQINRQIHFRGDGSGEGVTWELKEPC